MKLKLILLASLFAIGFAMTATAGSVSDGDSDLVPDQFDNCSAAPNGPNEAPNNQVDTDIDGYGNRCDADFNNSGGNVDLSDFGLFLADVGNPTTSQFDLDADGDTDLSDFGIFLNLIGGPPGPSGLACAGTVPCTP
ncbi:MAG: hypothetical protein ACX98W_12595 [bacterium]